MSAARGSWAPRTSRMELMNPFGVPTGERIKGVVSGLNGIEIDSQQRQ